MTSAIRLADSRWAREPRVLGTSKIGGVISASCAPAPSPEARAQGKNWITARNHCQPYFLTWFLAPAADGYPFNQNVS